MNTIQDRQAGVISIFTVLFFMIFVSIITVGFVKIIGDEERQSINNDLSASALAAANSGVEEGKRILAYCRTTGTCSSILNSSSCNTITTTPAGQSVLNALGSSYDSSTNEGIVSQNTDYLQRWTCMILTTKTDDVTVPVAADGSVLVPLDSTSGVFNTITVRWHDTTPGAEDKPGAYPATVVPRTQPDWVYSRYPAGLRVELITHTNGNINPTTVDNGTHTIVLYPGTPGPATNYDIASLDQRSADSMTRIAPAPVRVPCATIASSMPKYACSANITLSPPASNGNRYYLRISSIYSSTHVNLSLSNGASPVQFDNVQPTIDVTGRTNDVFRRVSARVDFSNGFVIPNFALQSGQVVCKDMLVTDQNSSSIDSCQPYPAP